RRLELGDAVIRAASQREWPDHYAVRGSGLRREATYGDGEVLNAVDLIGDRGGVRARAGLPLPQELPIACIVGLDVTVGFAVKQHVRGGDQRAAALADRIGHAFLPSDLVGAGIDRGERAAVFCTEGWRRDSAAARCDAGRWPVSRGYVEVIRARTVGHRRPVDAAIAAGRHQGRGVPRRAEDAFEHPAFERLRTLWHNRIASGERLGCGRCVAPLLFDRALVATDQGLSVGAIENVDPAGLARLRDALAHPAFVHLLEQNHRARAIEIPQVVVHLLEVPGMFAFERHRHDRGAEQIIARTIGADANGLRSWLAGRKIDEAEIWIDRRCLPNIGATLFPGVGFDGIGIVGLRPGVGAELAGRRDGPEAPFLLAGPCVERREEAARLPISAGNAGIDDAVVNQRRGGEGVTILPAGELGSPDLLAGLDVEGNEIAVELAKKTLATPRRNAAVVPAAADRRDVLLDAGAMLPYERTRLAVEREHVVIAGGDVEDAVFDDRSAFKRILLAEARAQVRHPGAREILNVVAVDLGQRRIARVVPIAADGEPFLAGGLSQVWRLL